MRVPLTSIVAVLFMLSASGASSAEETDVLQLVRLRHVVRCAGLVRPGIAVPTLDGKSWHGFAVDVCRAIAAATLGDASRISFRPYVRGEPFDRSNGETDDVVFLSSSELVADGTHVALPLVLGPVVVHDALALLVPASGVADVASLRDRSVCVEAGSDTDRALVRYFAQRNIELREHPFQETDEMRQAYGDGRCDALAGPLSTLASVRADPEEGRSSDRVLPELLADDPIFCATPTDARWSQIVWWTLSALVDAEDAGVNRRNAVRDAALPGVPPAVGTQLGLAPSWVGDVIAAIGNYGEVFERNLGNESRFHLSRGDNASVRSGGSIVSLRVE
jgi:general L-amino acid transport system substrate-binding protein